MSETPAYKSVVIKLDVSEASQQALNDLKHALGLPPRQSGFHITVGLPHKVPEALVDQVGASLVMELNTLIQSRNLSMKLTEVEIFGPVLAFMPGEALSETVKGLNQTLYQLSEARWGGQGVHFNKHTTPPINPHLTFTWDQMDAPRREAMNAKIREHFQQVHGGPLLVTLDHGSYRVLPLVNE